MSKIRNSQDVRLWRAGVMEGQQRGGEVVPAETDLRPPRLVHHSPDGYEWGYGGSGPADLALNILAKCLPVGIEPSPPVKLFNGECSQLAWALHQKFKSDCIAHIPYEGFTLQGRAVDAWIRAQIARLEKEGFFNDYGGDDAAG